MMTSRRDKILAASMNAYILNGNAIQRLEEALEALREARAYGHRSNQLINRALYPEDTLSDLPDAA